MKGALLVIVIAAAILDGVAAFAEDCSSLASRYRQSTVFIVAAVTDPNTGAMTTANGSGVIVAKEGVVLTDAHVVSAGVAAEVQISGRIGSRESNSIHLRLLGTNPTNDIAVLQFADTSKDYLPVVIGNPWTVDIGQQLCSMGFPEDAEFVATQGILGGKGAGHGLWFTQTPSNPGESGAPVFRQDASLVALKLGEHDAAQNLNYLVPINLASSLLLDYAGVVVPSSRPAAPSPTVASVAYTNQSISCSKSDHPFARGYCAVVQCPQGQWSRGSVSLDAQSGRLKITQGLETDNLLYGVCGTVQFTLRDNDKVLAYGVGPQRCIPAKSPGHARIQDFGPDIVEVPAPIANSAKSIEVTSACAADVLSPLGLGFEGDVQKGTVNVMFGAPPMLEAKH
jgi:hypothetical protein